MFYPADKEMKIERKCPTPGCKSVSVVTVNEDDYWRWRRRDKIQDAMPYLSAGQREVLITGICGECWDMMKEE